MDFHHLQLPSRHRVPDGRRLPGPLRELPQHLRRGTQGRDDGCRPVRRHAGILLLQDHVEEQAGLHHDPRGSPNLR